MIKELKYFFYIFTIAVFIIFIANYYFSMIKFHKSSKSIVTDKMLQNFKWIGLLKIFFSNCKIIHCERNVKDNFLSIYKNNFNEITMNWTNEENDIILYYLII